MYIPGNEEGGERAVAHGGQELFLHGAGEVLAREADRRILGLAQVALRVAGDPVEHAHPTSMKFRFCVMRLPEPPTSRLAHGSSSTDRTRWQQINKTGQKMTALSDFEISRNGP